MFLGVTRTMPGGGVPDQLVGGQAAGPIHQVLGDLVLIDLPGVARVLLRAGAVVGLEPAPAAHAEDVEWFLQGHVRHVAGLQCGRLALRARP